MQPRPTCGPTSLTPSFEQEYICNSARPLNLRTDDVGRTSTKAGQISDLPCFADTDSHEGLFAPPLHSKRNVVTDVAQCAEWSEQRLHGDTRSAQLRRNTCDGGRHRLRSRGVVNCDVAFCSYDCEVTNEGECGPCDQARGIYLGTSQAALLPFTVLLCLTLLC